MILWTASLNVRLIELHALSGEAELSAREIATKLNAEFGTRLTRNGIIGRAHRLKLPPRAAPIVRMYKRKIPKKVIKVRIALAGIAATPLAPPKPRLLTIDHLRRHHCRWPSGDIETPPPFIYCGKQTVDHSSWCEEHYNRAHVTPRRLRS